ncbi:MAG: Ig-like domain-containing protein [Thermoguttaceae bacterium]
MLSLFRSKTSIRKGARPAPKPRKLRFDVLEDRRLLSISYLDNGVLRLGVDLGLGGAITYLTYSPSSNHNPTEPNIINSANTGREIQQSYYASPSQYDPQHNQSSDYDPWPWNAVQAGDVYGDRGTTLASSNDGTTIYVKSQPMQWALDNVPAQATMEEWITLDGITAQVHCRLSCARTDNPGLMVPFFQELPAIYTVGSLYQLVSYTGSQPFSRDTLTNLPQAAPPTWGNWRASENWSALLDKSGWGLGVYEPGTVEFIGGFSGSAGQGGANSNATGYMAPLQADVLDPSIVYDYSYDLILGSVSDIRNWVYQHPSDPRPDYRFVSDRQHWYASAGDAGPPSNGYYELNLASNDPQIVGPITAFQAQSVPKIFITAAYHLGRADANLDIGELYCKIDAIPGFNETQSLRFNIIPDGQYHTYELDLASLPAYRDVISQLRFDPVVSGGSDDYVDIASISYQAPGVNQAATATMPAASANPAIAGQPVTFTATVKAIAPGAGTPTGTVTFEDGGATLGTGALNASGTATFNAAALGAGGHTITAVYNGDANFAASSGRMTETLEQIATTTAVTAASNTSVFGQPVTFTATVKATTPAAGAPAGTVTFSDGGTILGSAALTNGTASFSTSALGIGTHAIAASYGGSASFKSSSGSLKHAIKQAASSVAITASANPALSGQPVTFAATVNAVAPSAGTPTGTVTFRDGGKVLGSGVLSGGTASFRTLSLSAGSHKITASYVGASGFGPSVSAVLKEIIIAS